MRLRFLIPGVLTVFACLMTVLIAPIAAAPPASGLGVELMAMQGVAQTRALEAREAANAEWAEIQGRWGRFEALTMLQDDAVVSSVMTHLLVSPPAMDDARAQVARADVLMDAIRHLEDEAREDEADGGLPTPPFPWPIYTMGDCMYFLTCYKVGLLEGGESCVNCCLDACGGASPDERIECARDCIQRCHNPLPVVPWEAIWFCSGGLDGADAGP